ncbi:MAG: hypothetical protein RMA76_42395 [Deltaproteobacteria bacterium]|jgi:hypothetical protein
MALIKSGAENNIRLQSPPKQFDYDSDAEETKPPLSPTTQTGGPAAPDPVAQPTLQTANDARLVTANDPKTMQMRQRLDAQLASVEPPDRAARLGASLDFLHANPDRLAQLDASGQDAVAQLGLRREDGSLDPAQDPDAARAWGQLLESGYAATGPGGPWANDPALRSQLDGIETEVLQGLGDRPPAPPYTSDAVDAFEASGNKAWLDRAIDTYEGAGLESVYGSLPGYLAFLNRPWDPGDGAGNLSEKFPMFGDQPLRALSAYYGVDDPTQRAALVDYALDPSQVAPSLLPAVRAPLDVSLPDNLAADPSQVYALPEAGPQAFSEENAAAIRQVMNDFPRLDPDGWNVLQNLSAEYGPISVVDVTAEGGVTGAAWNANQQMVLSVNTDEVANLRALREDGSFGPISFGSAIFHEATHFVFDGKMDITSNAEVVAAYANDDATLGVEELATQRTNTRYREPNGEATREGYDRIYDARTVPGGDLAAFEQSIRERPLGDLSALQHMGVPSIVFDLGGGSTLRVSTDFGFGDITAGLIQIGL